MVVVVVVVRVEEADGAEVRARWRWHRRFLAPGLCKLEARSWRPEVGGNELVFDEQKE